MKRQLKTLVYLVVAASSICLNLGAQEADFDDSVDRRKLEFFESKIRPVLIEHCYACHAADSKELQGGLRLDSRSGIRQGGDSGAAVVPGEPDESILLEALRYDSYEMPPSGQLPQHVIDDFVTWIEDGAVDPRDDAGATNAGPDQAWDAEAARNHWSFRPFNKLTPPQHKSDDWSRTDIDRFIWQALQSANLDPVEDGDKVQVARRLYFDLIGLPPTPRQIDEFVNDRSPDALERLIDRLLASKHFGERWGRHWLDVARYSDSSGGGRVLIFHDAWRYRDYVVNAYNEDKPFDEFVREQVAGDLLHESDFQKRRDDLTATGFLMLGPHNYELQDKELLRMEVVDEQIDVVGRAFLGLTLGCARCHDHKFDPIPTKDYYGLAGIFRSTESLVTANVSRFIETELPLPPSQQVQHDKILAEITGKEKELSDLKSELPKTPGGIGCDLLCRVGKARKQRIVCGRHESRIHGKLAKRQFSRSVYRSRISVC